MTTAPDITASFLTAGAILFAAACSSDNGPTGSDGSLGFADLSCSIPEGEILDGGPGKDGIPALTDPTFVNPEASEAGYLLDQDRVVGLMVDGEPLAIPLNIFWWHEIVNLNVGETALAITHCPLTGSSLGFDRSTVGGAEFGVSGLLFRNNLIMYDRTNQESLWPQMFREARCGPKDGTDLGMVPVMEMTWAGWQALHPDTRVVSSSTGFNRDYQRYPYGNYDDLNNSQVLFPVDVDPRRPPKERVLGIPLDSGGSIALPFGELETRGSRAAIHLDATDSPMVVFWDAGRKTAMAYRPSVQEQALSFRMEGGELRDTETGSTWRVDGLAVAGPLEGARLQPVAEAFIAFWFAWPAFYPEIELWTAS